MFKKVLAVFISTMTCILYIQKEKPLPPVKEEAVNEVFVLNVDFIQRFQFNPLP